MLFARQTSIPRLGSTVERLHRVKLWMIEHKAQCPMEYHVFDGVLTLWVLGWVGIFPSLVLLQWWGLALCAIATQIPAIFIAWRYHLHHRKRLRCDWLTLAQPKSG